MWYLKDPSTKPACRQAGFKPQIQRQKRHTFKKTLRRMSVKRQILFLLGLWVWNLRLGLCTQ